MRTPEQRRWDFIATLIDIGLFPVLFIASATCAAGVVFLFTWYQFRELLLWRIAGPAPKEPLNKKTENDNYLSYSRPDLPAADPTVVLPRGDASGE